MGRQRELMSIGLVFALAGFGILLVAMLDARATWNFVKRAERSEAIVVGLYAGPAHPEIEFTSPDGRKITVAGNGWVRHHPGEHVRVVFPAEAPERARLDERGALWFSAGMTGVLGAVLFLTGLINLLWR